jgi:hypothetical protein
VRSTDHEAPHCEVFCTPLSIHVKYVIYNIRNYQWNWAM